MTKLLISIASNDTQSSDFQKIYLECTRPGLYSATCTFEAEVTKRIHYADYTTVYRATLIVIDGDATHVHNVVLKTDLFSKAPKDGEPFFICFERAKPHNCEIRQHVILGHRVPGPMQFGCTELWRLGRNLGAWADLTVSARACGHILECSRNVVSRDVLDSMVEGVACPPREEYQRQQIREALEKLVDDVERWREAGCRRAR